MSGAVYLGMAIHNNARTLQMAIDSLLAQDLGDFQLVLSDDASTDGSREIYEAYARSDERIRYVRHEPNMGALDNLNYVAHQADSPYFMWAGPDDYWEPNLLSTLVHLMEENPDVAVATSGIERVDHEGKHLYYYNTDHPDTTGLSPIQRVRAEFRYSAPAAIEGLIRVSVLRKTGYYRFGIIPEDMFLLGELSLFGGIKGVPDVLFHKREGGTNKARLGAHFHQAGKLRLALRAVASFDLATADKRRIQYEFVRMMLKHQVSGLRAEFLSLLQKRDRRG